MLIARKMVAGTAEIMSLGLFVGMVWLWAAVIAGPNV
jgi:hypothetical protein